MVEIGFMMVYARPSRQNTGTLKNLRWKVFLLMESILFYSKKMLVTFLLLLSLTPKDCTFTEILEQE